jgi:hypothetical protein
MKHYSHKMGLLSQKMCDELAFAWGENKKQRANIFAWVEIEPDYCIAFLLFAVRF